MPIATPRYSTPNMFFTRDDLITLFQQNFPMSTALDVEVFLADRKLKPVGRVEYAPIPNLSEDMDSFERKRILIDHEESRASSMRSREVFDVNGLPQYVPGYALPSDNDEPAELAAKLEKIGTLK